MNIFGARLIGILAVILCLIKDSLQVGQVTPTREIKVAALDQTSKSLFTIYFSLDTPCPANYFLKVLFPQYNTVTPNSCWIKISTSSDWTITTCQKSTSENNVVYLQFPSQIVVKGENIVQIQLSESTQLAYASSGFIISTVNSVTISNQFTLDVNNNFGQIPWTSQTYQSLSISVSPVQPATDVNLPSQFITLQIQVNGEKSPVGSSLSPAARVKVVLDSPWIFTQTSTVTSLASMGQTRPVIESFEMESPNQMSVVFSEFFDGVNQRSFKIEITNVQNPYQCNTNGNVYVYIMDYNSNNVIESGSLPNLVTSYFPLTVDFQAPGGVAFTQLFSATTSSGFSSGGVFKGVEQYVEFAITSKSVIPAGYTLRIKFSEPDVIIVHGSAYIDKKILPNNASKPIQYSYPSNQLLLISNLASIPQTTKFVVSCRIYPLTNVSPIAAVVSMDLNPDLDATKALFQSTSQTADLQKSNPYLELPTDFRIIETGTNKLELQFNGFQPDIVTGNQSQLVLSFRNFIAKAATGSVGCTVGATVVPSTSCTFSSINSVINEIQITSPSNSNYFAVSTTKKITISNLSITGTSNSQDNIFQIYACLKATNNASSNCLYHVLTAVLTKSSPNTIKYSITNNNFFSSTSLNYYFPSIISAHFTSAQAFDDVIPGLNQVRFVTLFAKLGLRRLTGLLPSQGSYPCGQNSISDQITCEFMEGNTPAHAILGSEHYNFLDWDRVIFKLDDNAVGMPFRLSVPDIYPNNADSYEYIWAIGLYNQAERTYTYLKAANKDFLRSSLVQSDPNNSNIQEYIRVMASDTLVRSTLGLTLTGSAGQEVSNIPISVQTSNVFVGRKANTQNGYGGAVVINSEWYFWAQSTSKYQSNISIFGSGVDSPVSLSYTDPNQIDHFITLLPLMNTDALVTQLTTKYYLDSVIMPYVYDLPNYTIYVTNYQGLIDSYKEFYNSGSKVFYSNTITSLEFNCLNLAEGVDNTYCTITFQPSNRIQPNAKIFAKFSGVLVSTDTCEALQSYGVSWTPITNISCASNLDSSQLLFRFLDDKVLPNNLQYRISFYGVSIKSGTTKYLNLEIRDESEKFIIETKTYLITTTNYNPETMIVSQLQYANLNPYVYTSLLIKFQTPRQLYSNEDMFINLGRDLNDVNIETNRFHVTLQKLPEKKDIQISTKYVNQRLQVLFIDPNQFVGGAYQLNFTSLRSPASNLNDRFTILFVRRKDQQVVVQNPANQTVAFPSLNVNQNSVITLSAAKYLLEGDNQELNFLIKIRKFNLSSKTVIDFHYPVYYSPGGSDFSFNLFCKINSTPVTCSRVVGEPYKIRVSNSPVNVYAGNQFTLSIFGLKAPSYSLRYDSRYQDETLFVSVDADGNGDYEEFIHVNAPSIQPINNNGTPQKYIRIVHMLVDKLFLRTLAYHTLRLRTQETIPSGSIIQVLFPKEYTTLQITTQVYAILKYMVSNNLVELSRGYSPVVGRTVEITVNQKIDALTIIQIEFQNVPTPSTEGTVDFNEMLIQVFASDRKNLIARSYYLINTSLKYKFTKQTNYLQMNNDQYIVITKGTFTKELPITTSDSTKFQSNIYIQCAAVGFDFLPTNIYGLLGTSQGTIRIGADKNLYDQVYNFQVQKTEKIYQPLYNAESSMVAFVTSTPVQITVPPTIIVPKGGCSIPQILNIENAPFDELTISLDYEYDQYPEEIFKTDLEITSNILRYSPTIVKRYMSFCITDQFPTTSNSMTFKFALGGINAPSYTLSQDLININVINKESQLLPSLSLSISQLTLNSISINLLTNCDGSVYWNLYATSSSTTNLSLVDIKQNLRQQIYTIQQQSDNLSTLYNYKRDMRVGVQGVYTIQDNSLTVSSLTPGIDYKLCAYFETEFKINTGKPNCLTFTTPANGSIVKVQVNLTKSISLVQLNNLICFFVQMGKIRLFNLVDQLGNSCSFSTSPSQSYLAYKGQQVYNSQTINLYLFPTEESVSDPGIQGLKDLYSTDSAQLKASVLTDAQTKYQIDFISSSQMITSFSYADALKSSSNLPIPTLKSIEMTPLLGDSTATLQINQVSLSSDGVVYFIVENQKLIVDKTDTNVNISIRESLPPSIEQLINCKNYYGETAEYCGRIVVTKAASSNGLTFPNAKLDSNYKVYYAISNEYPITPVINTQVLTNFIYTYTSSFSSLISSTLLILLILVSLA